MKLEKLENFLNKPIFILYEDEGKICKAKGILKSVNPDSVSVETYNNFLIVSAKQILKIKIPIPKKEKL